MNYLQQIEKAAKQFSWANNINEIDEFWYEDADYCYSWLEDVYQLLLVRDSDVTDMNEMHKLGAIKYTPAYDLYEDDYHVTLDRSSCDDVAIVLEDDTCWLIPVGHYGTAWKHIGSVDYTQECECEECYEMY